MTYTRQALMMDDSCLCPQSQDLENKSWKAVQPMFSLTRVDYSVFPHFSSPMSLTITLRYVFHLTQGDKRIFSVIITSFLYKYEVRNERSYIQNEHLEWSLAHDKVIIHVLYFIVTILQSLNYCQSLWW